MFLNCIWVRQVVCTNNECAPSF